MQLDGTGGVDSRLVPELCFLMYVGYVNTTLGVPGYAYDAPFLASLCSRHPRLAASVRAFGDGRRGNFCLELARRVLPAMWLCWPS